MNYVFVYDVADNKLRNRIAKTLNNYGDRVQKSVFEIPDIDKRIIENCIVALKKIELGKDDSIRIYQVCDPCKKNITLIGEGLGQKISMMKNGVFERMKDEG